MTDINATNTTLTSPSAVPGTDHSTPIVTKTSNGPVRVGRLLADLQESAPRSEPSSSETEHKYENQLAVVRLGMATSLFFALRAKHGPTAEHCLRVALSCSAWAERMGLSEQARDRIEVAALLHDIGKIGIPDRVLRKPGKLSVEEQLSMDCCPELACEILRGCTDDSDLLGIVQYANTWYQSRRKDDSPCGDALPIGARMLSIANAFDAMTTDSVYRRAMSRERALAELQSGSGTQFDPELVNDFSRMLESRPEMIQGAIVDRWLQQLNKQRGNRLWTQRPIQRSKESTGYVKRRETFFLEQLVDNLSDGVVFTDPEGTITHWNSTMHRLTGIASKAIVGKSWSNQSIRLRERDSSRELDACIVGDCLGSGITVARPMTIEQPGAEPTPVHVRVTPVTADAPGTRGSVVIIRDLSHERLMEEQLETLHEKTTKDPLTGVSNRSHFDDTLRHLIDRSSDGGPSFSLIICDIDHFKRVNDVHGHPAGDEALVSFASILESHSRDGDLVARYGGEEFLLLAVNCDNATAASRAEDIRVALEQTPLPSLAHESVTASFGVTEYQSGDTSETIVSRADRGLLKAKDNGRNRVIQLGTGNHETSKPAKRSWLSWFDSDTNVVQNEFNIRTPVPVDISIEKLRGFIADHDAEIINVTEDQVSLKLNTVCAIGGRRKVDQQVALKVQMTLSESNNRISGTGTGIGYTSTNVHLHIAPIRNRDRRNRESAACIDQIVASLKSYLMGEIVVD